MGLKQATKTLFGLIILYDLTRAVAFAQSGATDVKPLDVMLLIDSSPSMAGTDPDSLRISAAHYLIDYLEATSQVLGVNFRAGVANFGGKVRETMPLRLVQGGVVHSALKVEQISFTDFRPPLDFALRELRPRSFGTDNQMLVIIFTDGNPELSEQKVSPQDKSRYFSGQPIAGDSSSFKMNLLARELQESGVALFVVAVGDASNDAQYWRQLIPFQHYRSIKTTTNLADVYHQFLTELVGFAGGKEAMLTAAREHKEILLPYLDQVIFSFIKDKANSRITVTDPGGNIIHPTMGGKPNELHEIYSIPVPRWDHPWQIRVEGSNTRMWVDQRMPALAHTLPGQSIVAGQPVLLRARLLRQKMPVIDSTLKIKATLTTPTSKKGSSLYLERHTDGEYRQVLSDLQEYGVYSLTFTASLNDTLLKMRSQVASFSSYPVPVIDYLIAAKDSTNKKLITFVAYLNYVDRLNPDTPVIVRILDLNGKEINRINLRNDGIAPDIKAGDEMFAESWNTPDTSTAYSYHAIVAGQSLDGMPYDSKFVAAFSTGKFQGLFEQKRDDRKKSWLAKLWDIAWPCVLLFFIIILIVWMWVLPKMAGSVSYNKDQIKPGAMRALMKLERKLQWLRWTSLHLLPMRNLPNYKSLKEHCATSRQDFLGHIRDATDYGFIESNHFDDEEVTGFFKKRLEALRNSRPEFWKLLEQLASSPRFQLKRVASQAFDEYLFSKDNPSYYEALAEATKRGIIWELRKVWEADERGSKYGK